MNKRVADRGVAWLCVLAGAVMVAGCSDLTNSPPGRTEAGVTDGGGKVDGKSGSSGGKKDAGSSGKAGGSGSSSSLVGGGEGGAGGSSPVGGQSGAPSSSAIDAGIDAPVPAGNTAGAISSSAGGSGGASVVGGSSGGTTPPVSSGGTTPPASSGGTAGSNSRDAGYDLKLDVPVNPTVCTTAATCPAPSSGNGAAVCQGGNCSITCNNGYHRCGNACLANDSPANCGSSCNPCTSPASNGSATCGGNPLTCGVKCNIGFHACGSNCVVDGSTSNSSCGNTCQPCTAPANGSVNCNGRNCVQACNSGYHLCNGTCLPNRSVDGCGTASCTPCRVPANGSPTCDGSACGFECNSNYHKCGNNCASNTDPNNCGTTCKVCPGDLNGTAACDGDCKVDCKNGFHWCPNVNRCVANDSTWPGSCGNSCKVCPTATDAVATCVAGECGLEYSSCTGGLALCGTDCVAPNDTHCGATCKDCTSLTPPSTDTQMVCKGNTCIAECKGSLINCAGAGATPVCISPTSDTPDHCGGSCAPCPADKAGIGTATCSGSPLACGISCGATAHLCPATAPATSTTCYENSDITHCGTAAACSTCTTTIENAEAVCEANTCTFHCIADYHPCPLDLATPCHSDADSKTNPASCGMSCLVCNTETQECKEGSCTPKEGGTTSAAAR